MVGRSMADVERKSYTKEYIYLAVSALTTWWLIQAQNGYDEDKEIRILWNVVKICRRIEVFFGELGDRVYQVVDSELENRRTM
jgi:hypothetical protein